MGQIFTAYMGGTQEGIAVGPIAILWNQDATKAIRIRRVVTFSASPQYRERIGGVSSPLDLMFYPAPFSVTGYFERPVLAHDMAAPVLGDVVVASGQGVGAASIPSVQISGVGQTIRRGWNSRLNPGWALTYVTNISTLQNCPYFGEIYRAQEDATVQPITLRKGEALVLWCNSVAADYLTPANVVFEFEQVNV